MISVVYGGANGTVFNLEQNNRFVAVRTRSKKSLLAGPVYRPEREALNGFELFLNIPEAGVEVYEKKSTSRSVNVKAVKQSLQNFADIRFAGRVLVEPSSQEPIIYTENIFVKFADRVDAASCLSTIANAGLTVKRKIDYLHNAWFVAAPEGSGQLVFTMAAELLEQADIECCHPELVRRKGRRQVFDRQWHLKSTTINGVSISASAKVESAHNVTRGEGTVIAIIDDGVDIDHPEFAGAAKVVASRDFQFAIDDPRPKFSSDNHGTPCAGVACANGTVGASGVAPAARLMPIRNVSALGSQAEADSIAWAADQGADIISCSWGPPDGAWWDNSDPSHTTFSPLPDSTRLAIDHAIQTGRRGKGCVIVWAAGNGNEDVQFDGYAAYPSVFAIAACNDTGKRSVYSDFGDEIFCAFPSNDFGYPPFNHPNPLTAGIWATDRRHGAGYNEGDPSKGDAVGDFTNSFGGTSSAAPGAAGIAALVLSVNPDLNWSQVGDVMRRSCDIIDPGNGNYQDGHSPLYGYGRINAETAVQLAAPTEELDSVVISGQFMEPIADLLSSQVVLGLSDQREIAGIRVSVDIRHTYIGDLTVVLKAPSGDSVVLHNREGFGQNNIVRTYDSVNTPDLAGLIGQAHAGDWTLEVNDHALHDQGFIRKFALELQFVNINRRKAVAMPGKSEDSTPKVHKRRGRKPAKTTPAKRSKASQT